MLALAATGYFMLLLWPTASSAAAVAQARQNYPWWRHNDERVLLRKPGVSREETVEAATKLFERRGMRRIDIHADAFYTAAEMASANKKTGAER